MAIAYYEAMKICPTCSDEFQETRDRVTFCSHKCQARFVIKKTIGMKKPGRKKGKDFHCLVCKKTFYVPLYRVKKNEVKYCSRSCLAKNHLKSFFPIHGFKKGKNPPRKYLQAFSFGRKTRLHRAVMEEKVKRKLESWEHVHHIDGNPLNNDISNLVILTNSEHGKVSYLERLEGTL